MGWASALGRACAEKTVHVTREIVNRPHFRLPQRMALRFPLVPARQPRIPGARSSSVDYRAVALWREIETHTRTEHEG